MHVTVAICTWNRADLLDGTLASLAGMHIPSGVTWDVIVADNNSSDDTSKILARYATQLPLLTIFEKRQGKSHALNQVVRRLKGDLVLWTDDDVLIPHDWLSVYVDAARRWPHASFFGGHIIPRFVGAEPDWLRPAWPHISGVFAARDLGKEPFALDRNHLPFGANMAARVSLQRKYTFDPDLGRRGPLLLAGEETALMLQWLKDGYRGMWTPGSRIEHVITPDRLELAHLKRFYFSLADPKQPTGSLGWPAVRFLRGCWYMQKALQYELWRVWYAARSNPELWIKYLIRTSYNWGRVEVQWANFPDWCKPGPLRLLKLHREQPRYEKPVTVDTGELKSSAEKNHANISKRNAAA